jgi:pSer/pThr/pTyr-binding forkhead associated (FHA) protein/tRNA A-37 threonylcarbamoyl transferase component Bud32
MAGEQLRVTEGNERGKLVSVDADLLIGRLAADEEGRLGGDPEISRRHARVSRGANGQLAIEDLGSANGTFVNGERIAAPRNLRAGDAIRIGRTSLEVTEGVAAAPPPEPSRAPAGAVLVVTSGGGSGRTLAVADELVLGRGVTGDGKISDDRELSRRHARITRTPSGRVTVEDLGSANGTFVNGERVHAPRVLEVGDSVRIGSTVLELSEAGMAAAPPRPAAPARPAAPPPPPPAARPAPPPPPPPAARPAAPPPPPPPPAAPAGAEIPIGSVFAGCRVEHVISQGTMGVVYQADELALQRPVALKLIRPDYSSDERFRERFRRESRITAAIDHPNVIPVFDAGEERGVLYIMTRLVEGTDLRTVLADDGRLDPLRAARIVGQVGAALDAAHARGMLHRDVKPSNVLLARRDHVYLTDFGLAKEVDSGDALTRGQTVVARAEYIAPEQILNQRVDARADIYALGCLLYEALTGEPPFAHWTGGPQALAHLDAPVPSPRDLRPELPPDFDDVVQRAMAKEPSERYPSAGDLGQAALVAAGGLQRAGNESAVATGEAAFLRTGRSRDGSTASESGPPGMLRWAVALTGLVVVAIGMVAALHGISTL